MKKTLITLTPIRIMQIMLIVLFIKTNYVKAQGLPVFWNKIPNSLTRLEQKSTNLNLTIEPSSPPPFTTPRTMAEWEENQGILLSWGNEEYTNEKHDVLCEIIANVLQETNIDIYLVCKNSNTVAQYLLNTHSIQSPRIKYLIEPNLLTIWSRDFGPVTIYGNYVDSLSFMDWRYYFIAENSDGEVPQLLADYLGIERYENNGDGDFNGIFEGGNFMCDGLSTAFSTRAYDNTFEAYNGISSSRWLNIVPLPFPSPNYYNTPHIDIFMKLLDEETILIGRFNSGDNDYGLNDDINASINLIQTEYETHFGRKYKIEIIPMPAPTYYNGYYGRDLVFRSYTNSLIINNLVLVPTYNDVRDAEAIAVYETLMPGYTIVPINCSALDGSAGAIHCVTMGIGAASPIYFEHEEIRADNPEENVDSTGPYKIITTLKSQTSITNASLYWSNSPGTGYQQLPLVNYGNDNYLAYIPPQAAGNNVYYYLSVSNGQKTITKPIPAADGGYMDFQVDAGAVPPVNLSFSNEEVKSGIKVEFQASNSITAISNYTVKNGADVTFTAGNSITLNGPLNIELGAEFNAEVYPNFYASLAKQTTADRLVDNIHLQHNKGQDQKEATANEEISPTEFSLLQNYPNPFNSNTIIKYTLKVDCNVTLKIYNMLGQEVRTIINEYQAAGLKSALWDGKNNSGQNVSSGVYIYKITAGDFTANKKLVILK